MPKTHDQLRDPISRKALINAIQESANRHFKPLTPERENAPVIRPKPKRLISARIVARRLDVSKVTLSRHVRRGLIAPDFVSDQGVLFRPERLPDMREALKKNRERIGNTSHGESAAFDLTQ